MVIKVYIASSTGYIAIKKHQQAVVSFLEANRISFQEVDITMLEEQRQWMYRNIPKDKQPEKGNPPPPQIFNDDHYCGDYEDFFQSKEDNTVFAFLGLSERVAKASQGLLDYKWILSHSWDHTAGM
ncbi:SH3 domain-binding glutamic acid-rich-like protein 2 isoform X1 [Gymnodraco acuticeps]|uniref:SH3 domain-binding glutamic acid-rich-like protein 2 isoform X1 n=1 Tax=Gymnodraco acuticeps TaxID=8218 RepID=A0A6P8TFV8_GYMAC|nr:SH3 domain-binding glutamic acid-rich-like protein 2 isoform X1 [Gymnodraco acuticeps]